jgi:hypothetical protein
VYDKINEELKRKFIKMEEENLNKMNEYYIQLKEEAKLYGATDYEISNCSRNIECLEKLINKKKEEPRNERKSKRNRRR